MKKDRLLNGLDTLFKDNSDDNALRPDDPDGGSGISQLRISLIEPDRSQPRKNFDQDKLKELADNISKHGVLQPILVRPFGSGYRIVAGERRWRAARLAGLTQIPALVRELSDMEVAQISLIENLQREELDPIEEANAFCRLSQDFGMTQEKIAETVGKSRSYIANSVRLLTLPETARRAVAEKKLTVGHAKALCSVADETALISLMQRTIDEGLSVRQLESLAAENVREKKNTSADAAPKKVTAAMGAKKDVFLSETAIAMSDEFGISPTLKRKGGRIVMQLEFDDDDQLKAFMKKIADNADRE